MLGFRYESKHDWTTITLLGFRYTRYASGKTYFQSPLWFKSICFAGCALAVVTVLFIAQDINNRNACSDYGLHSGKLIKYSSNIGCYVLDNNKWVPAP